MNAMARFPFCRTFALAFGNGRARALAWSIVVALTAGVLSGCDERSAAGPAAPGRIVALELPTLDGALVGSDTWRGRTVVLNVWASWCGPCRAEMASLEALSRNADPDRMLVVGISVDDDRNLAREYLLRERISFTILSDATQQVARRALGVRALPTTLVIAPDGAVRARVAGARNWTDPALLRSLALPPLSERVQ